VSPKWVPQLADAADVLRGVGTAPPGVVYSVLTPNLRGLEAALAAGATEVAVFPAATESFNAKNLNCSTADSLRRFGEVARAARDAGVAVRGYVSVAFGCPYEGDVDADRAADVVAEVDGWGSTEVSLGDTVGTGTPRGVERLIAACIARDVPVDRLALHLHDTYGMAAANAMAGLACGVSTLDASISGLGGCPFSPGASGNAATEDVVRLLDGLNVGHGVDMPKLLAAARLADGLVGRPTASRAGAALGIARTGGSPALQRLVGLL